MSIILLCYWVNVTISHTKIPFQGLKSRKGRKKVTKEAEKGDDFQLINYNLMN